MATAVGQVITGVRITRVAHGGICVARHDGRVLFVRHAVPGELVDVKVTDDSHANYWRADVVGVSEASSDRVTPPCSIASDCGGCDWQHVSLEAQRRMKAAVVAEQLSRLAGIEWSGEVHSVPGDSDGLGWRTRMDYLAVDGAVGLRATRSHRVVELPDVGCLIARDSVSDPRAFVTGARERVRMVDSSSGRTVLVDGALVEGTKVVAEEAGGNLFEVDAGGFWQVHPGAAGVLVEAVMAGLAPHPGEVAFDLYCGVGLFAAALSASGCRVVGVEQAGTAIEHARRNVPGARFVAAPVEKVTRRLPPRADLIVLDPPRKGAGTQVCRQLAAFGARRIAYVACDPASLGRDLRALGRVGYRVASIEGFDIFPMTQHVECVAILESV